MNWGKWIVVSFVLFAAFIASLVVVCMRQDVNLVASDYYQQELNYQDRITRMENAAALVSKPDISVNQDEIQIRFAELPRITQGQLVLFRPSDPQFDKKLDIVSSDQSFVVPVADLHRGLYHAKFSWSMNGKDYFMEKTITL